MTPHFDDEALQRLRERLAERPAIEIEAPQQKRAAVLIPLIRNERGWGVIFSRRADNMASHSGQIAFPGGGVEPGESLEAAALRETHEEIGVPATSVELIGRIDDVITNSGYLVAPFAAVVHARVDYVLERREVVEVFEVPMAALLDPMNPTVRYIAFRNRRYPAYFYLYEHYEIWGLTGRITKAFLDLVWPSL